MLAFVIVNALIIAGFVFLAPLTWVVDRVAAEEERKDDAGDEGGDEVGGEVMVQEELARHGEERIPTRECTFSSVKKSCRLGAYLEPVQPCGTACTTHVADEVDLLAPFRRAGPEADPAQQERPIDRAGRVPHSRRQARRSRSS
jgi:hypothetical protein